MEWFWKQPTHRHGLPGWDFSGFHAARVTEAYFWIGREEGREDEHRHLVLLVSGHFTCGRWAGSPRTHNNHSTRLSAEGGTVTAGSCSDAAILVDFSCTHSGGEGLEVMESPLITPEIFSREDRRIITPIRRLCTGSLLLLTATVEHTGLAKPVQDRGQWEFPPPAFSQGAGVLIG